MFFAAQSEVLDDVLYSGRDANVFRSWSYLNKIIYSISDNHLIVSAPTGSGKTTILELAIVELLIYLESISYNIDRNADKVKIIYGNLLIILVLYINSNG